MLEWAEAVRTSHLMVTFWRTGTMACLFRAHLSDVQACSICGINELTPYISFWGMDLGSCNSEISSISTYRSFKGCVIITCYCLWSFSRCEGDKINLFLFYPEYLPIVRNACWLHLCPCVNAQFLVPGRPSVNVCSVNEQLVATGTSQLFMSHSNHSKCLPLSSIFQQRPHDPITRASSTSFLAIIISAYFHLPLVSFPLLSKEPVLTCWLMFLM